MTPFIDVMLVLLIIFMVAAPLSTVDVHVDLPASTAKPQQRPDKPLYITIKSDLSLTIGNEAIPRAQLASAIDDGDAVGQGQAPVPPRRPDRAVRRADERAEHAARSRLPQDRAGRT